MDAQTFIRNRESPGMAMNIRFPDPLDNLESVNGSRRFQQRTSQ